MKTLLVMAAGLGSRFGGLKQITPVGPNGEVILEYSVYDAIKAGFKKIVFVIKRDFYGEFKEKIGDKIKDAEVYYVFQENDNITKYVSIPKNRIKPLGTGHCVYSAKDVIKEKFAVINADDFYGRTSFMNLSKELDKDSNDFYIVGYPLNKTISNYGSVKRGVCNIKESEVTSIDECVIEKNKDVYNAKVINTDREIKVNDNTIVSMGMYGLNPSIFDFMEKDIIEFFNKFKDDKDKEYFLPDVVTKMSNENKVKIKVITTNSDWFGITYKEELESVKEKINKLIEDKVYPSKLF